LTNIFYNPTGNPGTGSSGLSATIRAEFAAIAAGFALVPAITLSGPPALAGFAGSAVIVNDLGTELTLTTGALALAGGLTTTGAFNTTLAQSANVVLTLPSMDAALATLGANTFNASQLITSSGGAGVTAQSGTNYLGLFATPSTGALIGFASGSTLELGTITGPTFGGFSPLASLTGAGLFSSVSLAATGTGTGLAVTNNATIGGTLAVAGDLTVAGSITGIAVTNNATIGGTLSIAGAGTGLAVTANATIGGTLGITGALTVAGAGTGLAVTNNVTIGGTLSIAGTGTGLAVTANATIGGNLDISGQLFFPFALASALFLTGTPPGGNQLLLIQGLPTSAGILPAGTVWNNSNVLNIIP
jgi:hypothetical protein